MDLIDIWTNQHLHVEQSLHDVGFYMTLTDIIILLNFALTVITFSFIVILGQNNTYYLVNMFDDFHMTLTFI